MKMGLGTKVTAEVLASVGTADLRKEDRMNLYRGIASPDGNVIRPNRVAARAGLSTKPPAAGV